MSRVEHLAESLQSKISIDASGCWLWTASVDSKGYGTVRWGGKGKKAHRVVFECLSCSIDDGLQLDHLCRVRNCVNPDHLEQVTCKENIARGRPFRPAVTHCPNGHEYTDSNTRVYHGRKQCKDCETLPARKKYLHDRTLDPAWSAKRSEYMRQYRARRKETSR